MRVLVETVRREWITTLLSRKSLPKDAERVIADALTAHRGNVGSAISNGNALAHTFLGLERPAYGDALAPLMEQTPTKARLVSLAVVLGGMEAATHQGNWRYGDGQAAAYLRQLAAWGYTLSPVEQVVTGDMSSDRRLSSGCTFPFRQAPKLSTLAPFSGWLKRMRPSGSTHRRLAALVSYPKGSEV